jgi:hypothetical protein
MSRRLSLVLLLCLAMSLLYNGLWTAAAAPIAQMVCTSEEAVVRVNAVKLEREGRWLEAAHHYAFLLAYRDGRSRACGLRGTMAGNWGLPLAVLAYRASSSAELQPNDRVELEASYAAAITNALSGAKQPSEGVGSLHGRSGSTSAGLP